MQARLTTLNAKARSTFSVIINGQELTLSRKPDDPTEVKSAVVGKKVVLGYLEHEDVDELEKDGFGVFHLATYHSTSRLDHLELHRALGLNRYGSYDVDHPAVHALAEARRAELGPQESLDEAAWDNLWRAARARGEVGNPFAVQLEKEEHGLVRYIVRSDEDELRAIHTGVWVPDDVLEAQLYEAMLAPYGLSVRQVMHEDAVVLELRQGEELLGHFAKPAEMLRKVQEVKGAVFELESAYARPELRQLCKEYAEQALRDYNPWLNGQTYALVFDFYQIPESDDPEYEPTQYELVETEVERGFFGYSETLDQLEAEMKQYLQEGQPAD